MRNLKLNWLVETRDSMFEAIKEGIHTQLIGLLNEV